MIINKVIVLVRLESGDSIECSVKVNDKKLSAKERKELDKRISQKIIPFVDESLYFTVRISIDGKKDNYKVKTLMELNSVLDSIFKEV